MAPAPETPPLPDPEDFGIEGVDVAAVDARVREILVDSLAYARIEDDPDMLEAVTRRRATEQAMGMEARTEAIREVRRHEERERARRERSYPWGVDHLKERREGGDRENIETIYAGLGETALTNEENGATARQRAEVLGARAHEEREFTLGIGERVAQRMREERIRPDVEIFVQDSETIRDRSGFRRHGRDKLIRAKKQRPTYDEPDHVNRGWMLSAKGTADDSGRVILLEDGSLLVAAGRLTAAEKRAARRDPDTKRNYGEFTMDRLDVPTNRTRSQVQDKLKPVERITRKRPTQKIVPERTYSRVIDQDLHSDIGLPNSASLGAAYRRSHLLEHEGGGHDGRLLLSPDEARLFFSREKELQDAMVGLLVKNHIPVERGGEAPLE